MPTSSGFPIAACRAAAIRKLVHAPGRLTGYDAKTPPRMREPVENRRFYDANIDAARTAKCSKIMPIGLTGRAPY